MGQRVEAEAAPVRFVVLSSQRSGSSWVIDSLSSHPRITTFDELFIGEGRMEALQSRGAVNWASTGQEAWTTYAKRGTQGSTERRPSVTRYLDDVYRSAGPKLAVGFKLMHSHVKQHPAILAYLVRRRVKVIHLVRRNVVDRVLSAEAVRRTGVSKSNDDTQSVQLRLNTEALLSQLQRLDRPVGVARAAVRLLGASAIEIQYEDLVSRRDAFSELVQFLLPGDAHTSLSSSLRTLVKLDHRELIENYEEVDMLLKGTRYEHMLRT